MPRKKSIPVPMRALTSFSVGPLIVREGAILMSDSDLVVGREHLFHPGEIVEQATAAPGEVRMVALPSKDEETDAS